VAKGEAEKEAAGAEVWLAPSTVSATSGASY